MQALLLAILLASSAMTTDRFEQPEDHEPLTSSPSSLVDAWGDPRFLDVDDPAQETWSPEGGPAASIGPAMWSAFSSGVLNGDFAKGPPDATAHIGDENRLPYWSWVVVQGGGITADWVVDASSPSGYAVEFTASDTAEDDEVYLEQIMPVTPRMRVRAPELQLAQATVLTTDLSFRTVYQCLKADGTTTGSAASATGAATQLWNATGTRPWQSIIEIPADARFLRVRVGVVSVAAHTGSASANLLEVYAGQPNIVYVTLVGSDISMPATGTADVRQVSARSAGTPVAGAERYRAPANGWVEAISVESSADVTGADIEFRVLIVSGLTLIGPTATIPSAGAATAAYATGSYDATTNTFAAGDQLRFRANIPSGTLTSTGNDFVVVAVLALLVFTDTTGSGS